VKDQKRKSSTLCQKLQLPVTNRISQIKKPQIRSEQKTLYYSFPPDLEQKTRPNLKRKLEELLIDGEEVGISDPAFAIDFKYKLRFV